MISFLVRSAIPYGIARLSPSEQVPRAKLVAARLRLSVVASDVTKGV